MKQKSKYVFAGSFDPFTIGHRDIVDRALQMCDEVIIAIGIHPEKRGMFSIEERKAQIQAVYADEPRVTVCTYEGLTVDFARSIGATALLRSIRTVKDMEYERDLADMNRRISVCEQYPQGIDTVFLFCRPEHTSVSSTVVRQLIQLGKDVSAFLPMLLFVVCSLVSLNLSAQSLDIDRTQMQKLQAAEFFISHFYVDSISDEKTVDAAIDGMLKQLDPHSTYIKAKDVERSTENLNGSFEGIGVQFNMVEDTLVVIQPVSGGPSEKKGVLAGDRIVTVNDTAIAGVKMSREEIMRRLRGPKDSKVRIGIVRNGVKGVNEFTIVRDKIPVHTLDASYMVDDSIGYIRLSSFGQTTLEEFMSAYNTLRTQGMRRLLLDLQGNGGGYLSAAVELANEFLPDGSLIVYTEGRRIPRQDFRANGRGRLQQLPVVVLVDSYTASAAEIVSGALQDNDRGTIVGRRTFAKGLVQRPFELPDKSVIRLTTSHYYSPSGRCIQKPYKPGQKQQYDDDINQRLKSGELLSADSIHFDDSLRYETLRLHRTVYGGGGIMPDRYVPLDTTQFTPLYRQLMARSCILNTSLRYMDKHRKKLRRTYPSFAQFRDHFQVPQELTDQLLAEATKQHVDYCDSTWQPTRENAQLMLRAFLARDLWDMSEYFQMVNPINAIYLEGLKAIKEEE